MSVEKAHNASATTGRDNIAAIVQVMLRKNAVIAPLFWNVSEFAEEGDRSISFPLAENNFVVQKLGVGVTEGDDQEIVYGLDKLELDEEAHIQWVVKKFDQLKARVPVLRTAITNATQSHSVQLDEDIVAELVTGITTTPITTGITQANIVAANVALNDLSVPKMDRFWIAGNGAYGTLQSIAGFIDASKSNLDIVRTGQIGTLYGKPVIESDVFERDTIGLFHKEALAYGFAALPELEDEKAIKYGTGSRRWVMDQNYGQKILNGGKLGILVS